MNVMSKKAKAVLTMWLPTNKAKGQYYVLWIYFFTHFLQNVFYENPRKFLSSRALLRGSGLHAHDER